MKDTQERIQGARRGVSRWVGLYFAGLAVIGAGSVFAVGPGTWDFLKLLAKALALAGLQMIVYPDLSAMRRAVRSDGIPVRFPMRWPFCMVSALICFNATQLDPTLSDSSGTVLLFSGNVLLFAGLAPACACTFRRARLKARRLASQAPPEPKNPSN